MHPALSHFKLKSKSITTPDANRPCGLEAPFTAAVAASDSPCAFLLQSESGTRHTPRRPNGTEIGVPAAPPVTGEDREGEVIVGFKPISTRNYRATESPAMRAHARVGAEVEKDYTAAGGCRS